MAGTHSSTFFSFNASIVSFCLLFCAAHILLHVSSNDLIHGDSPIEDPTSINHSANSHNFNTTFHTLAHVDYHMNVKLIDSSFVVKDGIIGSQKKKFDTIISTASNLNWVLCNRCPRCYKPIGKIFNPISSTSYDRLSYTSTECSWLPETIDLQGLCWYTHRFTDKTLIHGVLSIDHFLLQPNGFELNDFIFGCTHSTNGSFSKAGVGFMALGRSSYSFAAQMGRKLGSMKFSYCLPISHTALGWLRFGLAGGIIPGPGVVTTSLVDDNSNFYKATLEYIRVQGYENNPIPIKHGDSFVIDSATSNSYIDPDVLKKLKTQVVDYIGRHSQRRALQNDLCYDISEAENPDFLFPWITFKFNGGGEIAQNPKFAFVTRGDPNVVCLAFKSNELSGGLSIFGFLAQIGHHIEIDADNNILKALGGQCTHDEPTPLV